MQQSTTTAKPIIPSRCGAWWFVTALQAVTCVGWVACFWWGLS